MMLASPQRTAAATVFALVVAAVVFIMGCAGSATANATTEADNLAGVQAGFDAWSAGTGTIFDLLDDHATWEILGTTPVSRTYTSRADLEKNMLQPFNACMSGPLTPTVRRLHADGDTVFALFDATGTARDGVAYRNTYMWLLDMRDGRIVGVQALLDSVAFNDLWNRVAP
jgi:uncharacterized protein